MGCYENLTKYQKEVFRADIARLYEHLEKWGYKVLELSILIDPLGADQDGQNTNTKTQHQNKNTTNLKKKGTFTAVVKYAGSKYYNAKTVKPKIIVK